MSSEEDVLVVNSLLVSLIPTAAAAGRTCIRIWRFAFGSLDANTKHGYMDCLQPGYRMWILMVCIDSVVVVGKEKTFDLLHPRSLLLFPLSTSVVPDTFSLSSCGICNASIAI